MSGDIKLTAERIREAERRGAEWMRSIAARVAALPPEAKTLITGEHRRLWEMSAAAIRALPLEEIRAVIKEYPQADFSIRFATEENLE